MMKIQFNDEQSQMYSLYTSTVARGDVLCQWRFVNGVASKREGMRRRWCYEKHRRLHITGCNIQR
jgi:hypothetical protein